MEDSPTTILLVDDEPQIRLLLRKCFRLAGLEVVEADSGLTALALIESKTIGALDVLVTDIEMPEMDGLTLAAGAKAWAESSRFLSF